MNHASGVSNSGLPPIRSDAVPGLEPGVTLLAGGPEAVHRVVANELADGRTETLWVDPGMAVSVHALYDLAPSKRALSGLRIARAFTAYQHHALVRELVRHASPRTDLVVLPGLADLYRDEDVPDYERAELFESCLAVCVGLADSLDVPVLVADEGDDDLAVLAADYADAEVDVERTDLGLSFRGAGLETLGYWARGHWQTTIPYWVELFDVADPEESLVGAPGTVPPAGAAAELSTPSVEG